MYKVEFGWEINAYCPCKKCCGPTAKGISTCGKTFAKEDEYRICAAPKKLPCGKEITISRGWNGKVVVQDRNNATGKRIDIFCWKHETALKFGKKKNCEISYKVF